MGFVDRVAEQAPKVKLGRLILSVLAFPFYLVGLVVGLVVVSALFAWGGVRLGVADVRAHLDRNDGAVDGAD